MTERTTERLQRLPNGLYIGDFEFPPEEAIKVIEILQHEPSCLRLDTIVKPNNLLLSFEQSDSTSEEASQLYASISNQLPPYRVPTPQHGDEFDGTLKSEAQYIGLGGNFNWIKVRCPRTAVEEIRQKIQPDIRIGPSYWCRAGSSTWVYSKVRIPEQLAAQQLQETYTQITGENGFRYLVVIQQLKDV